MENLNIYIFTTKYVIEDQSSIVYVSHDDDGDWQFLGLEDNLKIEDARIVSLQEILEHDPTLETIIDLPRGKVAIRNTSKDKWRIL